MKRVSNSAPAEIKRFLPLSSLKTGLYCIFVGKIVRVLLWIIDKEKLFWTHHLLSSMNSRCLIMKYVCVYISLIYKIDLHDNRKTETQNFECTDTEINQLGAYCLLRLILSWIVDTDCFWLKLWPSPCPFSAGHTALQLLQ